MDQIEKMIRFKNNYGWLTYVLTPVFLFFKFTAISLIIYIGGFLFNRSIAYENCFKIVLLAELAPIIGSIVTFTFFLIHPPHTLQDVQSFSPLGLMGFFDLKQVPSYLIYPFKLLNGFEAAYWLILIFGVSFYINDGFKKAFTLVISSYGVGLFIWVLGLTFIQLQFS
jgi:hypothetical protein